MCSYGDLAKSLSLWRPRQAPFQRSRLNYHLCNHILACFCSGTSSDQSVGGVACSFRMVDAHAAIRSRTVAARSVLSSLTPGSPEHLSASALQVGALVSLLMRGSIQAALSKDEKAMLTVMMAKLPWAPNHLAKCLAALQGKDSACSRRPQQDFVSFLNYLSSFEWDLSEKHCTDFFMFF